MKKMNLLFGLLLLVAFLLSGYYMNMYFTPQNLDNIVVRMQIRSNHIYLLFISLLNIVSYKCVFSESLRISTHLHVAFSSLLILAGVLALPAFWYEHTGDINDRMLTFFSVVFSFSAIVLFLLNELISSRINKKH